MSRHRKDPLRPLTAEERQELTRLSRSLSAPAAPVERARALDWREQLGRSSSRSAPAPRFPGRCRVRCPWPDATVQWSSVLMAQRRFLIASSLARLIRKEGGLVGRIVEGYTISG